MVQRCLEECVQKTRKRRKMSHSTKAWKPEGAREEREREKETEEDGCRETEGHATAARKSVSISCSPQPAGTHRAKPIRKQRAGKPSELVQRGGLQQHRTGAEGWSLHPAGPAEMAACVALGDRMWNWGFRGAGARVFTAGHIPSLLEARMHSLLKKHSQWPTESSLVKLMICSLFFYPVSSISMLQA